jgi:hypothetical protein
VSLGLRGKLAWRWAKRYTEQKLVRELATTNSNPAYRGVGNEVGDGENFTSMSTNVCFKPGPRLLVADLNDVGERDGTVFLGKVLQCWLLAIELPLERFFDCGNDSVDVDRRF